MWFLVFEMTHWVFGTVQLYICMIGSDKYVPHNILPDEIPIMFSSGPDTRKVVFCLWSAG